jgi:hypothetical protein
MSPASVSFPSSPRSEVSLDGGVFRERTNAVDSARNLPLAHDFHLSGGVWDTFAAHFSEEMNVERTA